MVEDRTEGDWRITRRRTGSPIRLAAFNLGNYAHARVERGGYVVDVCANRALERALQPQPAVPSTPLARRMPGRPRRAAAIAGTCRSTPRAARPARRGCRQLAAEVASALEFMASKFGPPALPHLTVSPIPGTFGQGFPGLIYLSTLSYLKKPCPGPPTPARTAGAFFQEVLQAHEVAHQWWGNRVTRPPTATTG